MHGNSRFRFCSYFSRYSGSRESLLMFVEQLAQINPEQARQGEAFILFSILFQYVAYPTLYRVDVDSSSSAQIGHHWTTEVLLSESPQGMPLGH